MNNFAVLRAIITQLTLIDWPRNALAVLKIQCHRALGNYSNRKPCISSKAYLRVICAQDFCDVNSTWLLHVPSLTTLEPRLRAYNYYKALFSSLILSQCTLPWLASVSGTPFLDVGFVHREQCSFHADLTLHVSRRACFATIFFADRVESTKILLHEKHENLALYGSSFSVSIVKTLPFLLAFYKATILVTTAWYIPYINCLLTMQQIHCMGG